MYRKMISRATLPGCFILAFVGAVFVLLGSGQVAPTTPNEDEVVLPLNVGVAGNPIALGTSSPSCEQCEGECRMGNLGLGAER